MDCLSPARLLRPCTSSGKNTGVGCCFLSRASSRPRNQTWVSCIAGRLFIVWATREAHIHCFPSVKENSRLHLFFYLSYQEILDISLKEWTYSFPPANPGDARYANLILGWEDPLEEGMATTPVFLLGESHGQRILVGLQSIQSQTWLSTYVHTHTHTSHIFHMSWWNDCKFFKLFSFCFFTEAVVEKIENLIGKLRQVDWSYSADSKWCDYGQVTRYSWTSV